MKAYKCDSCSGNLNLHKAQGSVLICEFCGTQHVVAAVDGQLGRNRPFRIALFDQLLTVYNKNELRVLVNSFGEHVGQRGLWDILAGETLPNKAQELVMWAGRHACMYLLLETLADDTREMALWLDNYDTNNN